MTASEAKNILEIYRPGNADVSDPQIRAALEFAQSDPQLQSWLDEQVRFHSMMRENFRQIAAPDGLKEKILAQRKIISAPRSRFQFNWMQIAAAFVLLLAIGFGIARFNRPAVQDNFTAYQARMVRSVLREYHMDIVTNDFSQVREFVKAGGAPVGFSVPKGLAQRPVVGGGILKWRNNPVTMVCYDRGDDEMLFFFVIDRNVVKSPPETTAPQLSKVNKLLVASWSDSERTYILAGAEEAGFVEKYF